MLNTNRLSADALTTDQYDWLVNELQTNTATWTIVTMHNPMYSAGRYGANPDLNSISLALRSQLQGIFAEYGVDIVLQGHDHAISRTNPINGSGIPTTETWQTQDDIQYSVDPDGVLYLMNGPSGEQSRTPYAVDKTLYNYAQESKKGSWAEFTIDGNQLTVKVNYLSSANKPMNYQTWGILKTA
jgi:hypothetical protein